MKMKNNTSLITIITLIVALGGLLMGFDASVISGVVKFIEPEFELTKLELGWAVASLTLTATLAMIPADFMVSGASYLTKLSFQQTQASVHTTLIISRSTPHHFQPSPSPSPRPSGFSARH